MFAVGGTVDRIGERQLHLYSFGSFYFLFRSVICLYHTTSEGNNQGIFRTIYYHFKIYIWIMHIVHNSNIDFKMVKSNIETNLNTKKEQQKLFFF